MARYEQLTTPFVFQQPVDGSDVAAATAEREFIVILPLFFLGGGKSKGHVMNGGVLLATFTKLL